MTAVTRRKIDLLEFGRAGQLASAAVRKERIPPAKRSAIVRQASSSALTQAPRDGLRKKLPSA